MNLRKEKKTGFLRAGALLSALFLLLALTGCPTESDPDPVPPAVFTAVDGAAFNGTNLYRAAFGAKTFVITGANSTAWYSSDGITWTAASDTSGLKPRADADNISGLNFVNQHFLATGGSSGNVARAYSSDGKTWASTSLGENNGTSFNAKAVAYGAGKYLVGGSSGRIAYADALNGTASWTVLPNTVTTFASGGKGFINALAFGAGKFVAGGGNGHTAYSADGLTWEANAQTEEIFNSNYINDISYGGDKFVAVGEAPAGTIAYSSDGVNWTQAPDPKTDKALTAVAYGGGYFVAVGKGPFAAYSADGATWTAVTLPAFTGDLYGVTYGIADGKGKFVISGGAGEVAYAVVE